MTMTFNVAIVGTGIFATTAHLPALQKSPYFTPYSCFNRTKAKAETFAKTAGISKIYNTMEEAFEDPEVDLVDALLPVQYNLDAVKLAVKHKKAICLEKPIAANVEQAAAIVKLSEENPDVLIVISEQWAYMKAIDVVKDAVSKIGKVYSFTHHATGQFNFGSKYLPTTWRLKPQHIGGYLSDGGVHQLALLTGIVGKFKSVNAHTRQIRKESGTDDILYSLVETDSGVIGTFTYGSAFGNTTKDTYLTIMGDNGSVHLDFSPGKTETVTLRVGGGSPDAESYVKEIEIPDEERMPIKEFNILGETMTTGKSKILATPETTFHHLAIIDAALKSSKNGGATEKVIQ